MKDVLYLAVVTIDIFHNSAELVRIDQKAIYFSRDMTKGHQIRNNRNSFIGV